jgi:hypothetical protein
LRGHVRQVVIRGAGELSTACRGKDVKRYGEGTVS